MFQSSPGTLAGRYAVSINPYGRLKGFNPRPALWPGATGADGARSAGDRVSILARHSGRALRCSVGTGKRPKHVSILARHSGRALPRTRVHTSFSVWFQSSPGTLAGRYKTRPAAGDSGRCFNPRPALWPGATSKGTAMILDEALFQSSPGTLAGRYGFRQAARPYQYRFNPRPALWPGATWVPPANTPEMQVSILARHSGRALHQFGVGWHFK